jgi:ABC-type transport system involved in multi-copper enzyme maturation permease subunit
VIAAKTWREVRFIALAYLLILELLAVPVILLWPDFYPDLQKSTLLANLGIEWLQRIGEAVGNTDERIAYVNYCALMLFFRSTNLVGLAAAVLLGTGLFAREREAQTLEFLLARPVSRSSILWHKFWPCVICLTVPIFLVNASAVFWSRQIGLDLPWPGLLLASLHAALFVLAFFALATWLSVLCRVQAHVAAWVGAVAVVQIGVYLTQRIRGYSLFRLADFDWYNPIRAGNTRAWQMFDPIRGYGYTTYVLAASALFYGLAWRCLRRIEP